MRAGKRNAQSKKKITDKSWLSSDTHKSKHPRQIPTQSYQAIRLPFGAQENASTYS
jgi:hypothetical protein